MNPKKNNRWNVPFMFMLAVCFLGCINVTAQINANNTTYEVKSGEITLLLGKAGNITALYIGKSRVNWIVSGDTQLKGLHIKGNVFVKRDKTNGSCHVMRIMEDSIGHTCVVTDIFTPEDGSIRWEISIKSKNEPWTAPIITQLKFLQPEEKRIWAAWSDPNHSDEKEWHDPFVFSPFQNQQWAYGNQKPTPEFGDFVSIPMISILDTLKDKAVSVILSPADHIIDLKLSTMKSGAVQFCRENNRICSATPLHFVMHIVAHEADWRGGLRWMVSHHPGYFNPVNKMADNMGGCGGYSGYEEPVDAERLKKMAFRVNWKLSDDFAWMGMFLPPLHNYNDTWKRACDEPLPPGKDSIQSFRKMNEYARWMQQNGFYELSYFNVTEFGRNMSDPPKRKQNDTALWKDPVSFVKYKLPDAVLLPGSATFYGASVMDCGDPAYQDFLLEQAQRHIKMLPYSAGICIDRLDWLNNKNLNADDGRTMLAGKTARSLIESWKSLLTKLGPVMHQAKKVIFVNPMTMRLDLMKDIDGFYSEHGESGAGLNSMAFISIRKPAITWTCMWWGTWDKVPAFKLTPDADQFFQRHLFMGVFPTAPYPYNNHAINPHPETDKDYMDYGPLLTAMRGRKWVLAAHCAATISKGVKVNLFEVPAGYIAPVTFGGTADTAVVYIRNIPGLSTMKATVIQPGSELEIPVSGQFYNGTLELQVPIRRGCAMVILKKNYQ